ncbi:MAG: hypothetical protein ABIQ32_03090 [Sphingomicrobium sp.]
MNKTRFLAALAAVSLVGAPALAATHAAAPAKIKVAKHAKRNSIAAKASTTTK